MSATVIPHACDAIPSHAYYLVYSCLKSNSLTHYTNNRYFSCVWCNIIARISSCPFLFEIQSTNPPYQHQLFLMCMMQHHHAHIMSIPAWNQSVNPPCQHQLFLMRVIHPCHNSFTTRTRTNIVLPTLIICLTPYLFFGNRSNIISSNNTNENTTTKNNTTICYSLCHE